MPDITVTDVGPIKDLKIQVPKNGGVVVLRGRNGTGKSHAVAAIESLVTGQGSNIVARDGVPVGEVEAFGATLRIARRVSRLGELTVSSLEGKFSISDLVDPKLIDPLAADAKRIKALIQLARPGKADPALFYDLVGGQEAFDQFVTKEAMTTEDLVTMAAKIKRDLEKAARTLESKFEQARAQAEAARSAAGDVDPEEPCDSDQLSAILEEAVREEATIREANRVAERDKQKVAEASASLTKIKSEYDGPEIEPAQEMLTITTGVVDQCVEMISKIEQSLVEAKANLANAKLCKERAQMQLTRAVQHKETVEVLESVLKADRPPDVDGLELAMAEGRTLAARRSVERGAIVRLAKQQLEKASELKSEALEIERQAIKIRDASQSTDMVLSAAVQNLNCPLYVSHGRLVTPTDRGEEQFAELSKGEKFKLAIGIASSVVKKGGVFVLEQEGWEGLDPENKRMVAELLEGTGVIMITAQCSDDDEVTPEVFEPYGLIAAE